MSVRKNSQSGLLSFKIQNVKNYIMLKLEKHLGMLYKVNSMIEWYNNCKNSCWMRINRRSDKKSARKKLRCGFG